MRPVFITKCTACGKRIRYSPEDEELSCGACGTVQGLEDGRGRADYNGEIEDVLRYTIALPD